jgi:hypothetical protein
MYCGDAPEIKQAMPTLKHDKCELCSEIPHLLLQIYMEDVSLYVCPTCAKDLGYKLPPINLFSPASGTFVGPTGSFAEPIPPPNRIIK